MRFITTILLVILIIPIYSDSADFSYKPFQSFYTLNIDGDINKGDYEKFVNFIKNDVDKYLKYNFVLINSNGGSVLESIYIGDLLKKTYRRIIVMDVCASSCFFIYLGAVTRSVDSHYFDDIITKRGKIGVHRPYYIKDVYSYVKPNEAEKLQSEIMLKSKQYLTDNFVPQTILDKMYAHSSKEIYWLTRDEIDSLGDHPAWYQEFLGAKCGYDKNVINLLRDNSEYMTKEQLDFYQSRVDKVCACASEIERNEAKKYIDTLIQSRKKQKKK